jgi:hypothetical protein
LAVVNRRLGASGLNRHAANGVDKLSRRNPTQIAVAAVLVGVVPTVVMAMAHDVRAASDPHHEEKQPGQKQKIQNIS